MADDVFKTLRCKCGWQIWVTSPEEHTKTCERCQKAAVLSKNWYVKVRVNGKRYIEAVGPIKRQAEEHLKKAQADITNDKFQLERETLTWDEACKLFVAHNRANVRKPTADMYEFRLIRLKEFFGGYKIHEISPQMVTQYKEKRKKVVTNTSINREIATIKRMFNLLSDGSILNSRMKPYLENNQLAKVKKLEENAPRKRVVTIEEMCLLIKHAVHPLIRIFFLICVCTGLRKSNILQLEWSEIDFEEMTITIPAGESKNKKEICIDLLDILAEELLGWKEKQKDGTRYVLPSPVEPSGHYKDPRSAIDHTCVKAGIARLTSHILRHGFATLLAELNAGNLRLVQAALSQNSLTMAKRYTHVRDKIRQKGLKKVGDAFRKRLRIMDDE
jgi:integrase